MTEANIKASFLALHYTSNQNNKKVPAPMRCLAQQYKESCTLKPPKTLNKGRTGKRKEMPNIKSLVTTFLFVSIGRSLVGR